MVNFVGKIVASVLIGAFVSHIGIGYGMALANPQHRQQPCSQGGGGLLLGSPPPLVVERHETCTHWYQPQPGDSCSSILLRGGLSPAELAELNENVDNICEGELKPGAWLCLASEPELPKAQAQWFGLGPAVLRTGGSSTRAATAAVATTSPALHSVPSTVNISSHTAFDMETAVAQDEPVDLKKRNDDAPAAARTLESHHRQSLALPYTVSMPRMRNTWFAAPHHQQEQQPPTAAVVTATDHPGGSMSADAETTTTVTHTFSGGDADDSPTGSLGTATFTGPGDGKTALPSSSSSSSSSSITSDLPDNGDGGDGKTAFPINSTTTSTVISMVATTTSFIPVIVTTTATLSSGSMTTPTLWRRHHPRSRRRHRPQQQQQQQQQHSSLDDNDSNPNLDSDTLSPEQAAHCSRRHPTVDRCLAAINGAETSMLGFCAWYTDPARPAQSQTAIVQFAAPAVRHQAVEEQGGKNSGTLIPPPLLPRPAALEQACARATGAPAVLLPPLYLEADVDVQVTGTAAATTTRTTRPPHVYLSSACSCLGHFDRSHRLAVAAAAAAAAAATTTTTGVPDVFEADATEVVVDDSDPDESDSDSDVKKRSNNSHSHNRR